MKKILIILIFSLCYTKTAFVINDKQNFYIGTWGSFTAAPITDNNRITTNAYLDFLYNNIEISFLYRDYNHISIDNYITKGANITYHWLSNFHFGLGIEIISIANNSHDFTNGISTIGWSKNGLNIEYELIGYDRLYGDPRYDKYVKIGKYWILSSVLNMFNGMYFGIEYRTINKEIDDLSEGSIEMLWGKIIK